MTTTIKANSVIYPPRYEHFVPTCRVGSEQCAFTCDGWQITRMIPYGRWWSVALRWAPFNLLTYAIITITLSKNARGYIFVFIHLSAK